MRRRIVMTFCILVLIGGCAQPKWEMEQPKKPQPSPELQKLSRLIGNWTGTAEWVYPPLNEINANLPEGEKIPSTYGGGGSYAWTLDGMFLKGEGWYEMGADQPVKYVEYWSWDAKAKKYRTWSFSDWGECGDGLAWFDPADANIMYFKGTVGGEGGKRHGSGKMTFISDDTYDWAYAERGPEGRMEFKGTSKRVR